MHFLSVNSDCNRLLQKLVVYQNTVIMFTGFSGWLGWLFSTDASFFWGKWAT